MWPFKKKQEPKPDPAREQVQAFAAAFEAEEFDLVAVTGPEDHRHAADCVDGRG